MNITESPEFQKEFKKLLKKYQTLAGDFKVAKKSIAAEPAGDGTRHWNVLWQEGNKCIVKVRMMCRAVKGASFRLIYLYNGASVEIMFIEVYFKGKKERENIQRINDIVKTLKI